MATLDGLDLFGLVMSCATEANPKDRQVNAYPGADGLQVVDNGARGGVTRIAGALVAPDRPSLAAAVAATRAYELDGGMYAFVDQDGVTWPDVILAEFRPEGVTYTLAGGGFGRKYVATLLHAS